MECSKIGKMNENIKIKQVEKDKQTKLREEVQW